MAQVVYSIQKMDCPTEEQIIRNRLKSFSEIDGLEFDLMNRRLTVKHRMDDTTSIQKALQSIGMPASPVTAEDSDEDSEHVANVTTTEKVVLGLSGVFAFGAELMALTTGNERSWVIIAMSIAAMALGGRETLRKGIVSLRTFTLNINFLMTIAIIGAAFIGEWPEAAMVTVLFALAEMIEAHSLDRARHAIRSLMEMSPDKALVRDESGQWVEVDTGTVQVGNTIRVRPGERVALDGEVISGSSSVNQAPITGESMPVPKSIGDTVFAGSINERGSFEFNVTANRGNTTLSKIIRSVQQAQAQRAPTQRFVDSFARYYTPAVVVMAILLAALPPLLLGQAFQPWLYKALVMLVIACPCALVISTPVTVVSALASAAKQGILIKGGVYLENGRRLKAIALDKTGTLTHGTPIVTDVISMGNLPSDEVYRLAASLDAPSEHPVASAIVKGWASKAATANSAERDLLAVANFEAVTGRGVKGDIAGRTYYVGNHRYAHESGVCSTGLEGQLESFEAEAKTAVVLFDQTNALGVIAVADTIRDSSIQAVKEMHDLKLRIVMLTGDNERTAKAIASKAAIDDVRGDLLPEDKLEAIDELVKEHGFVGMVGDGVNDAPALARSNIGFAMGVAGTDTAIETADVALMTDDLRKLPAFVRLSAKAGNVLVQNISLAIGIKAVFFALALAGVATLWMAVFADLGASLLVVFNGLRLLRPPADMAVLTDK